MNKIKNILILTGLVSVVLSSCKDNFLDPYPNGQRNEEDLWKYPNMVNGLIGYIYDASPRYYDNIDGSYFECITDNAVASSTSGATNINNVYRWSMNAITTGQDNALFCDNWSRDYRFIANCNISPRWVKMPSPSPIQSEMKFWGVYYFIINIFKISSKRQFEQ